MIHRGLLKVDETIIFPLTPFLLINFHFLVSIFNKDSAIFNSGARKHLTIKDKYLRL